MLEVLGAVTANLHLIALPFVLLARGALHAQQQSIVVNTCKEKLISHTFPFWIHVQIHLPLYTLALTLFCCLESNINFASERVQVFELLF